MDTSEPNADVEAQVENLCYEGGRTQVENLCYVGSEGLPKPADSAWKVMEGTLFPVRTRGALETGGGSDPVVSPGAASTGGLSTGGLALRALGESSVEALGLEWQLQLDEEVTLRGLESLAPLPAPVKPPATTPPANRQP